jgi:hypothetical protein
VPEIQTRSGDGSGGWRVNQGNGYIRIAPTRSGQPAPVWGDSPGIRWPSGQLHAAGRQQQVRQRMRKSVRHAHLHPQHPGLQHRGGQLRHRLRPPGARSGGARALRRRAAPAGGADGRHARSEHHAQTRSPRAARGDRSRAGSRPARRHRADCHRAPSDGGGRSGGLAIPRSLGERGLRRAVAPARGGSRGSADDLPPLRVTRGGRGQRGHRGGAAGRPGAGRWSGAARQPREDRRDSDRAARRPVRPPAGGATARLRGAGVRLADRIEALRGR